MDPAVGPGFAEASLCTLKTPALVIGSVDDDFLPFAAHAGRIASLLGSAEAIRLADGEGHFVYVDRCNFLGGALLVTNEAAVHILLDGLQASAQTLYGVSKPMPDYRLRVSGAYAIQRRVQSVR